MALIASSKFRLCVDMWRGKVEYKILACAVLGSGWTDMISLPK
jgi:hypothetical protein